MAKYNNLLEDHLGSAENSEIVLKKRYYNKNEKGEIVEDAKGLARRVAGSIALADKIYDERANIEETTNKFYNRIYNLEFMPNSPTLMNAGKPLGQLSACFVIPIEDSMDSIFHSLMNTALIHKSGGGTGFDFSDLRPKNDIVSSTSGVSSGPISFMKVYNEGTEAVKQGGKRRGANMGILRVDHPDILEFINCKDKEGEMNNFNISVALTDNFMDALKKNSNYDLINPKNNKIVGKLNAAEVYNKIVEHAWKNGEPGIIFIDKINKYNPTPEIGTIKSTNPCGEQPLLPYESCNLGSINLKKFVKENDVDWKGLEEIVGDSVHFLDNVIDMNKFPLEKIEKMTKANRKIGLGVMGWADMLAQLAIPYNSKEAVNLGGRIMKLIQERATEKSYELAEKRGAFPNFDKSIYKNERKRRNATITTIAPTGTISIIANVSSGIEPFFGLVYKRENVLDNDELFEVNHYFEKIIKERGLYSKELLEKIMEKEGSIQNIKEIPEDIKRMFVTAHDMTPEEHLMMQAEFQKYTHNAVSKTVNFRHNATKEDVKKVYDLAYELECKGITVYRDKSREKQVLTTGGKDKKAELTRGQVLKLPEYLPNSDYVAQDCPWGKLHMHVDAYENNPVQIFTQLGKGGEVVNADLESISRLASLCLRLGGNLEMVIKQLIGVGSQTMRPTKEGTISSLGDAVAVALKKYLALRQEYENERKGDKNIPVDPAEIAKKIKENKISNNQTSYAEKCPECDKGILIPREGCWVCSSDTCGFSKC